MVQDNKLSLKYIGAFVDFFLNIVVLAISYFVAGRWLNYEINEKSILIAAMLAIFASAIYFMFDLYSAKRWERLMSQIVKLVTAQAFIMGVAVVLVLVLTEDEARNFVLTIIICLISLAVLITKKIVATKALHYIRIKNKNPKYVLIVGNGYGAIEYARQVNDNLHFGYRIIGCVTDAEKPRFKKLGNYSELDRVIKEHRPHEVVIALENKEDGKTQRIINICDQNGIRASIIPVVYKYFKSKCQVDMVGNLPLINTRAIPLDNIGNSAIKRAIDIVFSLILIILTSPIMLFAAIGVRLTSKGPVIFKQTRVGKNNKEFTIYKFRSMKVEHTENDEDDDRHDEDDESRKTRFGVFMRRFGIDELPQFFNVLFGSMSIVGPRPELPKFVEEYSKTIPLYMVKHQVKPGITGLAQIYGFRGDKTSIEGRIELDIKYIENWTLFNDFKIMVATPFKMFNRNEKFKKKK